MSVQIGMTPKEMSAWVDEAKKMNTWLPETVYDRGRPSMRDAHRRLIDTIDVIVDAFPIDTLEQRAALDRAHEEYRHALVTALMAGESHERLNEAVAHHGVIHRRLFSESKPPVVDHP